MMASAPGGIIQSRLLDGLRWVPVGAGATSAWVRGVLLSPAPPAGSASPAGRIQKMSLWIEEDVDQKQPPASDFYDSTVEKYAQMPLEKLSLKQMLQVGRETRREGQKLVESAQKVQLELPKRLARRLMDLQFLPYIVVTNPHIKRVYHAYYHAFNTLKEWPWVTTFQENSAFTDLLGQLVDKHTPMLDCLACGLRECMAKPMVGHQLVPDTFLDNMLRSRISRRVIAEQHINILQQRLGYVGVVCTDINLQEAVDFAAQRAQQVCRETYGVAPEVVLGGEMRESMAYIPNHLDYILYELLKNAMRAVVERHVVQAQLQSLPAVEVRVCFGHGDVTVRISDQGGGIADEELEKVWKYGYTTTHNRRPGSLPWGPSGTTSGGWRNPGYMKEGLGGLQYRMAGLGFGLPLSRLYARYFGGDLRLVSMPGYGVDAYLNLKWLHESHWKEEEEDVPMSPLLEAAAAGDVAGPLAADSAA